MMNYNEYYQKVFPEKSVRIKERKDYGLLQNFLKYLAIRFGYILYKLRLPANLLNVIGVCLSALALYFLVLAKQGEKILPVIGVLIVFFEVWVDFIDGLLAKAFDTCSLIGERFDDLGCDSTRMVVIVLFGIFSDNDLFIILNAFSAYVLVVFWKETLGLLPEIGIVKQMRCIYIHKYSFLSIRFMLGFLLIVLVVYIQMDLPLKIIGCIFSIFYCCAALLWLIICIPHYKSG